MEEEMDLSPIQFPILSNTLQDDVPLHLCECPYCRRPFWVMSTPEYYFTCHCGGISFFENLTLRAATAAEYRFIRNKERMETVGFA